MRVRFAPSPTGFLHIGNARTALANYIMAKKHDAVYTLRIEDTDRERSTRESEESILHDLHWLGIQWDEGPDRDGPAGPYRQSERFHIYKEYTDKLLKQGDAYYCYCSKEKLDAERETAEKERRIYIYPGTCRNLTLEEREKKEAAGIAPSVRFRLPENETIVINDLLKGEVSFNSEHIGGDFIIVRSDGTPIYNYIVTIDDTLMGITHVIRGEDHLSNTPKQVAVARALGLPEPVYAHQSLVLGPDRSKLSKRHGMTSVALYRESGYLPEALVNYLGLLGWATDSGEEILSLNDMINEFDLEKLSKSSPVFDFDKLKWMNGMYIRHYDLEKITALFIPYLEAEGFKPSEETPARLREIIEILRPYCELLPDITSLAGIFFNDINEPDEETAAVLSDDEAQPLIIAAHELFQETLHEGNFAESLVTSLKEKTGLKGKKLFHPIRALVTGRLQGPELDKALPVIGYGRTAQRITYARQRFCS